MKIGLGFFSFQELVFLSISICNNLQRSDLSGFSLIYINKSDTKQITVILDNCIFEIIKNCLTMAA